jgi:hypothetical protein
MFAWLFASKPVVVVEQETKFSSLNIGERFQKIGSDIVYVKTDPDEYETANNGWHCTKWYRVHEDFMVQL